MPSSSAFAPVSIYLNACALECANGRCPQDGRTKTSPSMKFGLHLHPPSNINIRCILVSNLSLCRLSGKGYFAPLTNMSHLYGYLLQQPIRKNVASRLVVKLDAPDSSEWSRLLDAAALHLSTADASVPFYSVRQTVGGEARLYTFDVPYALSTYTIVLHPPGLRSAQVKAISRGHGQVAEATIVPLFNFDLRWNMLRDGAGRMYYKATLRNTAGRSSWLAARDDGYRAEAAWRGEPRPRPRRCCCAC